MNTNFDYDIEFEKKLKCYRIAGSVHKKVKNYLLENEIIKPKKQLLELCNTIESKILEYNIHDEKFPLKNGIALPTGLNKNNIVAHWTPETNSTNIITENDLLKINYGVHYNGYIIDSAFSIDFEEKYKKLIEASKEGVEIGIKNAGVDASINDISEKMEEVVCSYEIEIEKKEYKIKPMRDLCGHSMERYEIHSNMIIPAIKTESDLGRIGEKTFFTMEVFATTGNGESILNKTQMNHYMLNKIPTKELENKLNDEEKTLYNNIKQEYYYLPFTTRWLEKKEIDQKLINELIKKNVINVYPLINDIENSYVSQREETLVCYNEKIEQLS